MRPFLFAQRGGLGILLSLAFAVSVSAQGPRLEASLLTQQGPLDADQQSRLTTFVDHWVKRLDPPADARDGLTQVSQAMRALGLDIARTPGLSPTFRIAYSQRVMVGLKGILDKDNDRAAICALYVAGTIGTDQALSLIIEHLQSDRPVLRNAAGRSGKLAMEDLRLRSTLIGAQSVRSLIRAVGSVAREETAPVALQRQLELLDTIYTTSMALPGKLPDLDLVTQAERIAVLGRRASQLNTNIIEVDAMDLFIKNARTGYIALASNVQGKQGPILANHLETVLANANSHWDAVQSDVAKAKAYERLIDDSENFLKLIDQTVRAAAQPPTPNTKLKDWWIQKEKPRFEQDLQHWSGLMQIDPYRGAGGG